MYRASPMSTSPRTATIVAARIPYANASPFYALWGDAPFAVRNLVPRELGREAEAGSIDLGLMAAGDYLRLKDRFEILGPFGLATHGPAMSVLLFSRRPASALAGALISVTPETSTSIRLLRLLLGARRGLNDVRYLRGLEPAQADAMLVIGDNAMRLKNQRPEGFTHTLDLGADWLEWTGASFVYAVWAARRTLEESQKLELREFLDASLAAGLATLPEVARQQTGPGWTAAEMEGYLRRFRYRLGPEDLAGLARFEELLLQNGLIHTD